MPMLVDTHCHLDQLEDPRVVLEEAAGQGVERVVAVSEAPDSMRAALELKQQYPEQVLAGIGLHPAWVVQHGRGEIDRALAWMAEQMAAADLLGEVGLDFKWAETAAQQALQDEVLQAQFELAALHSKPVNLHSRRCLRQTMERAIAFRRQTGLNAQLHWFVHSKKLVRICNAEGIYVSVGPTIIDHLQTQGVAATIADELLLLESDAPVPVGGRAGHPARVREVAETLAGLKGVSWEEVAELTSANFARYLGGSSS